MDNGLRYVLALTILLVSAAYLHASVLLDRRVQHDEVIEVRGTLAWRKRPAILVLSRDTTSQGRLLRLDIRGFRNEIFITDYTKAATYLHEFARPDNGRSAVAPGGDYNVRFISKPGQLEIFYKKNSLRVLRLDQTINRVLLTGTYASGKVVVDSLDRFKCLTDTPCGKIQPSTRSLAVTDELCPRPPQVNDRIVAGINAPIGSSPWQVAIRKYQRPGSDRHPNDRPHTCGGILIDSCWVLSAAHCFPLSNANETHYVRVGDYNNAEEKDKYFRALEDPQDIRISRVVKNDGYWTYPSSRNDIALLFLEKGKDGLCAHFGPFVQPICQPTSVDQFSPETRCSVSGWGATEAGQAAKNYPSCLQSAEVVLKSKPYCKLYHPDSVTYGPKILDSMVCAEGRRVGSRITDTCQGDSGGPLVCASNEKHTIWGITSWGEGCGSKPGVYTRVFHFLDWVNHKMFETCDYEP